MGLFDIGESQPSINAPVLPEIGEWDEKQFLTFEKDPVLHKDPGYLPANPTRVHYSQFEKKKKS